MKRRFVFTAVLVAVALTGYLSFTTVDTKTQTAVAAGQTYSGTVYVAGHGGHFAQADVTVDPSNAADPIKMNKLDKMDIGNKDTHVNHDARIDNADKNIMFWATYKLDPTGKMHVGKSDLKTGKVLIDIALTPDPRSTGGEKKMPLYCASGQSKNFFLPVFMGVEAYVDVFDKKDLSHKHRVFISDLGYAKGTYQFAHGTNSPDMKTFILSMNQVKDGKMTGDVDFVTVDMAALEGGKLKQIAKNTLKGTANKTITFREYYSNDGKLVYQSAGDRLWVIDAKTLKLADEKMLPEGNQLHDAMTTPDDKFALLTVRTVTAACDTEGKAIVKEGKGVDITDGTFMLYDASAKKLNEKSTSTCLACHKGMGLGDKNAILCGLDANWKK